MGKDKLKRFAENETFEHLFQPVADEMYRNDFHMKGRWHNEYFKNSNPIVLEVGCGKGEYTTSLAEKFPDTNFIGIDFKGARLWKGCKAVADKQMNNVGFIRNKIEFVNSFFSDNEISEIWITFPDPQPKKQKKRLTSSRFLNNYNKILKENGFIHLKTDSVLMHEYTKEILKHNDLEIIQNTDDLYNYNADEYLTGIQTHYEKLYLKENKKITYLKFELNKKKVFSEPPENEKT